MQTFLRKRLWLIFIAVAVVIAVFFANSSISEACSEKRSLQLNRSPVLSTTPRAVLTIEDVNPVEGSIKGTIQIQFPTREIGLPQDQNEITDTTVTLTASDDDDTPVTSGPIVGKTELFTMTRDNPVSSYFTGETEFIWQVSNDSSTGVQFPFDEYRLPISEIYLVPFGTSNTIYPINPLNIRIGSTNLVTTSSTQRLPETSTEEILIRLVRPWPLKALFSFYALLIPFYLYSLASLDTTEKLSAALIGLISLFGARETLTRGIDLYPNLVDYVLLLAFVASGYILVYKAITKKKEVKKTPTH